MRSKPIGQLLLEQNLISEEDLATALKLQEKNPIQLGQILLKKGLLSELDLVRTLAKQYRLESREKIDFKKVEEKVRALNVPVKVIQKNRMVPFAVEGKKVYLAVSDPLNIHPIDDFRLLLNGLRIEPVLVPETEILRIIHTYFDETKDDRQKMIDDYGEGELEILSDTAGGDDAIDMANEAPIIKMVNVIISQAVHERASDIHIEPFEKTFEVRFRVDGIMHKVLAPPKAIQAGVISRIKIMASLNIAENRLPQDGRIKIKVMGKDIDIRVSTIPCQFGERIVMRLLNKTDMNYSLSNLGFNEALEKGIKTVLSHPNGIFLVTGPTGSGKSTTLYSGLQFLNSPERCIITVEDPVEYQIAGIAQMQMKSSIGLNFATGLRAILRQDPDVIMVGEIRDKETANVAAQAALTGHMVFSTLHTNDAPSAVTRLVDMEVEPFLITSTVRAVLGQRLVRRLCTHCRKKTRLTAVQAKALGLSARGGHGVYEPGGCDKCMQTGYRGRVGVYELLVTSPAINQLILDGADANKIRDQALDEGMVTMRQDGIEKVLAGVTTVEEVNRVT